MTYELGILAKGNISSIRTLALSEYEGYLTSTEALFSFSRNQRLYTIVLLNHDDFLETLRQYAEMYAKNPGAADSILIEKMELNINRHILNYLASVRTYLDHTQTKLKKKYGEQSERYLHFKRICKELYDSNFSYRFLSKLRNYAQHCETPLGSFELISTENPPYSGHVCSSLEAKFKRENLLQYDLWGSELTKEISKLPSEFDIEPHIVEMMKCIGKINLALIEKDFHNLRKSAEYIEKLISPAKGKEGTPCILQFLDVKRGIDSKVESMKIKIITIPFHIIAIVLKMEDRKSSQ